MSNRRSAENTLGQKCKTRRNGSLTGMKPKVFIRQDDQISDAGSHASELAPIKAFNLLRTNSPSCRFEALEAVLIGTNY